jgi:hypothetical protein
MQAILLTEIFIRFRGRKTVVRTSRHFEALYDRVSRNPICLRGTFTEAS